MSSSSSSSSSKNDLNKSSLILLSPSVRSRLRSGVTIPSAVQCMQQLVHNSLDADSANVDVILDLTCFKIRVSDDGQGLDRRDLLRVGDRHLTSKCRTLQDLEGLQTVGYRGEALASIRDVAGFLQIVSKVQNDDKAYVALFIRGERRTVAPYFKDFGRVRGTSVSVLDFMYNLPVRQQKSLRSPHLEVEECKRALEALSLSNPEVSFTLTDESLRERILETEGGLGRTKQQVFCDLFGRQWATALRTVSEGDSGRFLKGFVSTEGVTNKTKQFLLVNKRHVTSGGLLKLIRAILKKSVICRQPPRQFRRNETLSESPTKHTRICPVFFLELTWPVKECDFLPSVEFSDWKIVNSFINKSLNSFLRQNALLPPDTMKQLDTEEEMKLPEEIPLLEISGITPLPLPDKFEEDCDEISDVSLGCEPLSDAQEISPKVEDESSFKCSDYFSKHRDARVSKTVRRPGSGTRCNLGNLKRFKCDDEVNGKNQVSTETNANQVSKTQLKSLSQPNKNVTPKKTLSILPAGKTPFLPDKNRKSRFIQNKKDLETSHSKWRDESRQKEDLEIDKILSKWENPIFKLEQSVTDLTRKSLMGSKSAFKFDKSMFENLEVIGQVDRKFIASKIKVGEFENDGDKSGESKEMLIMFDQHAVHERIRLESLIEENFPGQEEMLYNEVKPPLPVTLSQDEARILNKHQKTINKFGINFLRPLATNNTEDDFASTVMGMVDRAPTCFLLRESSELKNSRPSPLSQLITSTLRELTDTLRETMGAVNVILPRTISDVLNSQACRSAIKFGDSLSIAACRRLVGQLSSCKAPFQCAHGRPSVVPVVDIDKILRIMPGIDCEVNLANLHSLMAYDE